MISAFCIAAPNSGSGKTTISAGLMRLLSRKYSVQAFKCGPDYIDTSYHKTAAGRTSYNLDTWLMGETEVKNTFTAQTQNCGIAVIEGVMGLFDGKSQSAAAAGTLPDISGSTAHIAQLLNLPVILVADCKGMAQSISAVIRGFSEQCKEYGIKLAAIIANNVGSAKHYAMLQESLSVRNLPPLIGFLPKNSPVSFKEHQLGLPHLFENTAETEKKLDVLADILNEHIDIQKLLELTAFQTKHEKLPSPQKTVRPTKTMAVAYDRAFCFYYPQNFASLEQCGYRLQFFSPLKDNKLPKTDAVYLGGGYPEIYAKELSQNSSMRKAIKDFAEQGGNIFAECGGFVYLCSSLQTAENNILNAHRSALQAPAKIYPFCGVIQAEAAMGTALRSLGYREGTFMQKPFFWQKKDNTFKGHEFHWSDIRFQADYKPFVTINNEYAGIIYKNTYASYIHFYFGPQI